MSSAHIERAQELLGHEFNDRSLLLRALTHASDADHKLESNERLEFLGDAILGLVVCEHLFREHPELLEGDLTKIKSSVVSRDTCARVSRKLGLDELLILGKGMRNRGEIPRSLGAGGFEAVIGAIYLDADLQTARDFILSMLESRIEKAIQSGHQHNFKSVLQQIAQRRLGFPPQYIVLDEKGPDHSKCFEVCVEIGARRFSSSWGASKKRAEQQAALNALCSLGFAEIDQNGDVGMNWPEEHFENGSPYAA